LEALTLMGSPVWGLRAVRALRSHPVEAGEAGVATFSPFFTVARHDIFEPAKDGGRPS